MMGFNLAVLEKINAKAFLGRAGFNAKRMHLNGKTSRIRSATYFRSRRSVVKWGKSEAAQMQVVLLIPMSDYFDRNKNEQLLVLNIGDRIDQEIQVV